MDFIWVIVAAVVMIGLCAASGREETLEEEAERLAREPLIRRLRRHLPLREGNEGRRQA